MVIILRTKPYNPDRQIWAMKDRFPQFRFVRRGKYDIEFIGDLHVRLNFPVYTVSIRYRGSAPPLVKVLNPKLVDKPPHFYRDQSALCLYHPKDYHWTKEKLIASNIVSWTAAWIYFYELWLRDDKWYGPEADHSLTTDSID